MAGGTEFQRREGAAAELTVASKAGHRRELIDIAGDYVTEEEVDVNIGGKIVFRMYPSKNDMTLIGVPGAVGHAINVLELLRSKKPEIPRFYAAQDEDLSIVAKSAPTTRQDMYFYDMMEGDVISHTMPGGSDGLPRPYIAWMSHSKAINATGVYEFDTSLAPTGMPAIKNKYTFSGFNFRMLGIIFACAKSAAGTTTPTWLRMFDGDVFMFDDDRDGLLIDITHNELKCDVGVGQMFMLERPHVFRDKVQIGLEMYATHDAVNDIAAGVELLGLVGLLEPIA